MAKPNRELLSGGKRYKEAKKLKNRVNEVVFDKEKRKDYLTGFHKRKLERKKKAHEFIQEQEKKARLEERAQIREERKLQVQKKLAEMKQAMELNPFLDKNLNSDSEGDDGEDDETEYKDAHENISDVRFKNSDEEDEENEEWSGVDEENDKGNGSDEALDEKKKKKKNGILKKEVYEIDNEDAPVTGTSEVIIESLDNPNALDFNVVTKKMNVDLSKADEVLNNSITRAKKYARLMGMNDSPEDVEKNKVSKPRKKKFRYLSKTERKLNNLKEKKKSLKKRKKD